MDGDPSKSKDDSRDRRSFESVASDAVAKGYKVIEEQIRQGQQFARDFADRSLDAGVLSGDTSDLIERIMTFYTDLGALWFEMIESLARNPALRDLMPNRRNNGADGPTNGAGNGTGHASIPVEIVSPVRTDVKMILDLQSLSAGGAPGVHELRSLDSAKPPIRNVVFDPGTDSWSPVLRVTIEQGQPADTYTGVIIDTATNEPLGTLCIRIADAEPRDFR